jgi:putative flippase GtrA
VNVFLRFILVVSLAFTDASGEGLPYINVVELANFLLFPLLIWNVYVFAALFRRSFRPSVPVAFAIAIPLVFIVNYWVPAAFRSL